MEKSITIHDSVREQLRLGMIDEGDLRRAVDREELRSVPEPPGAFLCRPTLAVPRPLDPETAEMKRLEVWLRPVGDDLEIFAIRGLDLDALESES